MVPQKVWSLERSRACTQGVCGCIGCKEFIVKRLSLHTAHIETDCIASLASADIHVDVSHAVLSQILIVMVAEPGGAGVTPVRMTGPPGKHYRPLQMFLIFLKYPAISIIAALATHYPLSPHTRNHNDRKPTHTYPIFPEYVLPAWYWKRLTDTFQR